MQIEGKRNKNYTNSKQGKIKHNKCCVRDEKFSSNTNISFYIYFSIVPLKIRFYR